jgi:integrase
VPFAIQADLEALTAPGQNGHPSRIVFALFWRLLYVSRMLFAFSHAPPRASERAYAADWRDFCAFAARIGRARLPAEAETVALYVADLTRRDRRPATISRKLAAIAVYHRSTDHPAPTDHDVVRAVVRGTRRQLGVAQPQKTALEIDALRSVVLAIPDDLRGRRDRARLLVGWTAALRRSELVALEVVDLAFEPEGVVLTIRRSEDRPRGGRRDRRGPVWRRRGELSGWGAAPLARNGGGE